MKDCPSQCWRILQSNSVLILTPANSTEFHLPTGEINPQRYIQSHLAAPTPVIIIVTIIIIIIIDDNNTNQAAIEMR